MWKLQASKIFKNSSRAKGRNHFIISWISRMWVSKQVRSNCLIDNRIKNHVKHQQLEHSVSFIADIPHVIAWCSECKTLSIELILKTSLVLLVINMPVSEMDDREGKIHSKLSLPRSAIVVWRTFFLVEYTLDYLSLTLAERKKETILSAT